MNSPIDVLSLHFLNFLHLYTFYIFTPLNFSRFFLQFSMQGCPMGALFLELSSEPPCPYESFMWSSLNWIQRRQRKLKDNMVGLIFPLFGEKIDSGRRRLNSIPPSLLSNALKSISCKKWENEGKRLSK